MRSNGFILERLGTTRRVLGTEKKHARVDLLLLKSIPVILGLVLVLGILGYRSSELLTYRDMANSGML